jgi:hypothetical protein
MTEITGVVVYLLFLLITDFICLNLLRKSCVLRNMHLDFKKKCAELLGKSTCHGLPNVIRQESAWMRAVWLLIFFICLAYSIHSSVNLVLNFSDYNVLINYQIVQEFSNFDMPVVSFCSLNPFDFSNRTKLSMAHAFLNAKYPPGQFFLYDNSRTLSTNTADNVPFWTNTLPSYGMSLEKLILSCTFNSVPCDLKADFVQSSFSNTTLGRCYSFNLISREHKVKKAGMPSGLQMELFLGENEMQPCWKTSRGVAVAIHDRRHTPLFSEEQLKVQPGLETSIILGMTRY